MTSTGRSALASGRLVRRYAPVLAIVAVQLLLLTVTGSTVSGWTVDAWFVAGSTVASAVGAGSTAAQPKPGTSATATRARCRRGVVSVRRAGMRKT